MKPLARWLLVGVVAAWLLSWLLWMGYLQLFAGDSDLHVAQGYLESVDLFLRHDWLEFNPTEETIELVEAVRGTPAEAFYRRSYLQADVEAFNGGDRSIFRIENNRILSLDPSRHNIVLPFTRIRTWPGRLTFRLETAHQAELRGDGVVIELSGPTRSLREQVRLPRAVVPRSGKPPGERPPVSGEAVHLLGEGGIFFGKVHLIGDALLFNNREQHPRAGVSISGMEVPTGNHSRMDAGDLLKLRWPAGGTQYALLWSSILGEAPVLSARRLVNGQWRRTPEHPEPPLAATIVAALDNAMRRKAAGRYEIPERRGREEFDLALTLDAQLQKDVQAKLESYARRLLEDGETPFRAAVTVMDAKNGELLALASFPVAQDLTNWHEATAARERLLRNHNFSRLPIGSVAKVILSAAILDQAPFLAELHIPEYAGGEIDNLLGIALDPVLKDHTILGGGDHLIDFDEFIEKSSNKYAATLLTLATGVDATGSSLLPPAGEPGVPEELGPDAVFYLGAQPFARRPGLKLPLVSNRKARNPEARRFAAPDLTSTLEHLAYLDRLHDLFGIAISRSVPLAGPGQTNGRYGRGQGDDLVDTSLWLPLLDHLYGREKIPFAHTFFGVSPERENLAYNLIHDFRREYLSVILGGGSSTWTNPQVCRIFSQLVTGRKVATQLVRRIRTSEGDTVAPPAVTEDLGLNPDVRSRLVDALTRVAGPAGTAKALTGTILELDRELAAQEKVLGFFSKTGSPDNVTFVPSRTARALDALIALGALRLDRENRIVYRDSGPVDADASEGTETQSSLLALRADAGDMALLRRLGIPSGAVIQVCDTWNDSRPEDRIQFTVVNGKLVRAQKPREVESIGAAYVFTMGAYEGAARRPPAAPGYPPRVDALHHQPERALTVAIVVETQGNGPEVAVPFAKALIKQVLRRALLEGW